MEKGLKNQIKKFANVVLKRIIDNFDGKSINVETDTYDNIRFADDMSLTFQKWGDSKKPFFLILWHGRNFIMEFDLSRIIFNSDARITWILNRPTRTANSENLAELGYNYNKKISEDFVNVIHKQMTYVNKKAKRTNSGYIFAEKETISTVLDKFSELIEYTIRAAQQKSASSGKEISEELSAIEGQLKESKILNRKRNRILVEQVKKRDNYSCQACNFKLKVNGLFVVECHHKNPLNSERITSIEELVCLCPTCHRIAHKRKRPFSIEEIRRFLS